MTNVDGSVTIVGEERNTLVRLFYLRSGLRLELQGIRLTAKAPSCYSIVKSELGFKGNKQNVYNQLVEYILEYAHELYLAGLVSVDELLQWEKGIQ
tara:strand:+ start:352 stop:639 length:288 start_codon:yes stop_codon:yes gene_type:complete